MYTEAWWIVLCALRAQHAIFGDLWKEMWEDQPDARLVILSVVRVAARLG